MKQLYPSTVCTLVLLALAGCGTRDTTLMVHRATYVLEHEPQGAVGILDLRESLSGDEEEEDVIVIGQIGGIAEPWMRGQASFVIADPIALIEDEDHPEACDCPFCREVTDETEGLALVQFMDDHGSVLPIDAKKLFGFDTNEMVVVRGRAKIDARGHLVVSANGLYIRR